MAKYDRTLDRTFQALADPTRRAMVARLMRGPASVTELAEPFEMALPTVLGHLKKLEDGGLVTSEKKGRTRVCTAALEPLAEARSWIDEQRAIWEGRLDRLEAYLDSLPPGTDPT